MKPIKTIISLAIAATVSFQSAAKTHDVAAENVNMFIAEKYLVVTADIVLDSLTLRSNDQVLITPIVNGPDVAIGSDSENPPSAPYQITLPSILVSGRNMHISYERGVLRNFPIIKEHKIWKETRRYNGKPQTIEYAFKLSLEDWMRNPGTHLSFVYDDCGCGIASAQTIYDAPQEVALPSEMITNTMVMIPEIEEVPVEIHAGRARIQFEVDRTELHVYPYTCKNGQRIDNRDQIKMIDDSVKYALSDPNVELVGIEICGYASPESPYLHNEELANGRSRVLAEYLADRYSIPREKATYSAVIENWGEFRDMVEESEEITDTQRQALLNLIDAPATTPEEYDRKEWLLKSDPKFATLYKTLILPKWFPKLRATTFALHTKLKDLSDEELKEVIKHTPEKMSLNQMYRVARMYPADSDEFNDIMLQALKQYPSEQVAIANAAIAAIARGEYVRARVLLDLANPTEQVYKLRALIAESETDYAEASRYYELAGDTEKAVKLREKADKLKEILDAKD